MACARVSVTGDGGRTRFLTYSTAAQYQRYQAYALRLFSPTIFLFSAPNIFMEYLHRKGSDAEPESSRAAGRRGVNGDRKHAM